MQEIIETFENKCKTHDWFYEYQDTFENANYNRGLKERRELLNQVAKYPELEIIYNEYNPFNN